MLAAGTQNTKLTSSRTAYKTIAYAHHCFNTVAALAELLSQATYVNVQCARIAVVAVAPDVVQ